ncbi:MAG: aminotransferase class I/II-fold pyridoxal phosphate-dependent enzyme, partial [Pseudomonadota bacterium]|nr:aminotransferase class I/II-fold pyridoxal phosphate-dependent enzyme [Pseudomonadota bacterium]
VLRSFGKFFGLAGLRLGFAVAGSDVASRLRQRLGPWAVSGPALAIGAQALADEAWIGQARRRLAAQSAELAGLLERHGLAIAGRNALFVLARHDDARSLAQALARRHILVRVFDDRPGLLRFGLCRDAAGLGRLAGALKAIANAAVQS